MYIDKRMIYIVMAIMLVTGLASYFSEPGRLLDLLLTIPGLLIAITFHEYAHAYAADKLGDDTPRLQGRLTLNPLGHLDPIGSIMLLFAGFGWGKPVEVNPRNYDRRFSMDKADAIVSIAGPLMNFFIVIIFTCVYMTIIRVQNIPVSIINGVIHLNLEGISIIERIIISMIEAGIGINLGLGLFNLIPLPPLDGSKVVKPFLPYNAKVWFENNEKIIEMIFIALFVFRILGHIISPVINTVLSGVLKLGFAIFGIPIN